jgi:hypothetical protein
MNDNNKKNILVAFIVISLVVISPSLSLSSQHPYAQNNSSSSINNNSQIIIPTQSPRKDISGHYSNQTFGIEDIVFPDGWHGRALGTEVGVLVSMHPGNGSEFLHNFLSGQNLVVMLLQAVNNSAVSKLSVSKYCKELAANSTSVISGKIFQVYTVECPLSKVFSAIAAGRAGMSTNSNATAGSFTLPKGFNINGVTQSRVYEYKSPDRTYRLTLAVSSPLFSLPPASATQEKPDLSKYTSLIDTTAKTLKVK